MNFLQRTPFVRLFIPFILGIIIFQYFHINNVLIYLFCCISLAFIVIPYFIKDSNLQFRFRWIFGIGISIFLFSLAYFLSNLREKNAVFEHLNNKGIYRVELIQAPTEKQKSYACKVQVLQFLDESKWNNTHGMAIVYIQKDSSSSSLLYGDRLMIEAEFKSPAGAENPGGFNYAAYLKRQGILATAYLPSSSWLKTDYNTSFSLYRLADISRSKLLQIYKAFKISGDEFAVLAALTLGYTDALQPDLRASYSATGAMHILSVSGLHVGVVYLVFAFLLSFLNKSQRQKIFKTLLITLLLWLYAFLTGLSPSVVRATLMFSFVAIGSSLERKSQIYNTVFMSAFFMLLYNPDYLFDVGFQLSYAAVLSIIFFQAPISNLFPTQNKALRWLRDLFAVSLAAQLGTAPFTLYYFHQFPNYFLITNLVAIPLSSLVIYLAMLLLAVSFVPYVSVAVAFLLKWSLWLLNFLIVSIQNLPFSLSEITFDFKQMLLVILVIAFFSIYFYTKKFAALFLGLLSILTVGLISLHTKYKTLNSKLLIVYSGQKNGHINFLNQDNNYVISSDSTELQKIASSFWRINYIQKPQILNNNSWFLDGFTFFGNKRILILTDEILKNKSIQKSIKVDYLIIGNKLKPKMDQLLENVNPTKIIVDKTISEWYTESIRKACIQHDIAFYSVAENGAYILNFID